MAPSHPTPQFSGLRCRAPAIQRAAKDHRAHTRQQSQCRRPSISVHFAPSHSLSCCRSNGQRSLSHSLWSISTGGGSKLGRADARYAETGRRAVMNRGRDQKARARTRKRGSVAIFKVTRREQGKGDVVALRSRRTGTRATLTVGHRYPPRCGPHLSEKMFLKRA
ncbi:hypothetical protein C8F01DRAFT_1175673 [Mycena amicta]|nr:hypothetical protein C8F01DRAFT_1175673 [Mycena amicta]